jgi:hypothetical protein
VTCLLSASGALQFWTIARLLRLPAGAFFSLDHGERSIIALMAGACAEVVAFGAYDEIGATVDRERWTRRLERLGHDETELWSDTLGLVRQNLGCIEFVAAMLSRAKTLSGSAIDRIVGRE